MSSRTEQIGIFEDDVRFLARSNGGSIFEIMDGTRQLVFESQPKNPIAILKIIEEVNAKTKRAIEYCLSKGKHRDMLRKRTRRITARTDHPGPFGKVSDKELDGINALLLRIIDPNGTSLDEIESRVSASYTHVPD